MRSHELRCRLLVAGKYEVKSCELSACAHVVVRPMSTLSGVAEVTAARVPHSRAAECATC